MIADFETYDFLSSACEGTAVFHAKIGCAVQGTMSLRYLGAQFAFCQEGKVRELDFSFPNGIENVELKNKMLSLPSANRHITVDLSEAEQKAVKPHINLFFHRESRTKNLFRFTDAEIDLILPFLERKTQKDISRICGHRREKCCFSVSKEEGVRLTQWLQNKEEQIRTIESYPAVFIGILSKEQEQWHPFLRAHCKDDPSQLVSFLQDKFPVLCQPLFWKGCVQNRAFLDRNLYFHANEGRVEFHRKYAETIWGENWKPTIGWAETPDRLGITLFYDYGILFEWDEIMEFEYSIDYLGTHLAENCADHGNILEQQKDFSIEQLFEAHHKKAYYKDEHYKNEDVFVVKDLFGMLGYYKISIKTSYRYWHNY